MDTNKLLVEIEKEFDMIHACDCDYGCHCWENFKKRMNNDS